MKLLLTALVLMSLFIAACNVEDDSTPASAADEGGESTEEAEESSTEPTETSEDAQDDGESSGDEVVGGDVTIEHAQGTTSVPLNPKTVAVFDYSALDTLDQLGVEVAGLPKGNVPPFLSEYEGDEYANIGTLFEPDYEELNALDPDLIIVAGRSSAVYEDLADMAPTIDLTVDAQNFLPSFRQQTENLAAIFQKETEVEERLAEIDSAIEQLEESAAEHGGRGLIVMVSGGEVTAYGPGSRFGIIHDLLGVPPVEEDIEAATHGDAISFEFIQEMNPDLLYVIDRDAVVEESGAAAEEVLDNELVHNTTAWQEDAVAYLDPATWYLANAGLGTVSEMVEEISASLE